MAPAPSAPPRVAGAQGRAARMAAAVEDSLRCCTRDSSTSHHPLGTHHAPDQCVPRRRRQVRAVAGAAAGRARSMYGTAGAHSRAHMHPRRHTATASVHARTHTRACRAALPTTRTASHQDAVCTQRHTPCNLPGQCWRALCSAETPGANSSMAGQHQQLGGHSNSSRLRFWPRCVQASMACMTACGGSRCAEGRSRSRYLLHAALKQLAADGRRRKCCRMCMHGGDSEAGWSTCAG
mmetsp:Transcript_5486/g.16658  ORF Transcript_5486/g.16658 Transcript_5486/m.16658 type:complete len:237 (-) Transcript_5486:911-1621(-)